MRLHLIPDFPTILVGGDVYLDSCSGEGAVALVGYPSSDAIVFNPSADWLTIVLRVEIFHCAADIFCAGDSLEITPAGDSIDSPVCAGVPNSTGAPATTGAFGSEVATDNLFEIRANDLPLASSGYIVVSELTGFAPRPGGSHGNLCLRAPIGRLFASLQTNTIGQASWLVDLAALPQPVGTASAMAGETWNFQYWYRDANPQVTSNFSAAVGETFV